MTNTNTIEIVGIPLSIFAIIYLLSRTRGDVSDVDGNVFRINPWIGWSVAILSPAISIFCAILIFVPPPISQSDAWELGLGSTAFFLLGIYGVYCVTLRVRLRAESMQVSSFLGTRTTRFYDIGSIEDKHGKNARVLKVRDMRGKRILYVPDYSVPEYDTLVDLLRDGVKKNAKQS